MTIVATTAILAFIAAIFGLMLRLPLRVFAPRMEKDRTLAFAAIFAFFVVEILVITASNLTKPPFDPMGSMITVVAAAVAACAISFLPFLLGTLPANKNPSRSDLSIFTRSLVTCFIAAGVSTLAFAPPIPDGDGALDFRKTLRENVSSALNHPYLDEVCGNNPTCRFAAHAALARSTGSSKHIPGITVECEPWKDVHLVYTRDSSSGLVSQSRSPVARIHIENTWNWHPFALITDDHQRSFSANVSWNVSDPDRRKQIRRTLYIGLLNANNKTGRTL